MKGARLLDTVVTNASTATDVDEAVLVDLLDFAYAARKKRPAVLDLRLADDAEMQRLNRRHLGHDFPTDVLSFEDGDREDGRVRLGDVVIGLETARRVAAGRGGEWQLELAFYALHGLFHLLGMRDDTAPERQAMLTAQVDALRAFGFAAADTLLSPEMESDA